MYHFEISTNKNQSICIKMQHQETLQYDLECTKENNHNIFVQDHRNDHDKENIIWNQSVVIYIISLLL